MWDSKCDAAVAIHLRKRWNTQKALTGIGVEKRMMSEV